MSDLINRQDAMSIIEDIRDCVSVDGYWAFVERLNALPSADASLMQDKRKIDASSDLISRQSLIDALNKFAPEHYTALVNSIIMKEPSVEPEIIRCKDCKYASPNGKYGCKAYHFKQYEVHEMYADDFCSKAERREDAD